MDKNAVDIQGKKIKEIEPSIVRNTGRKPFVTLAGHSVGRRKRAHHRSREGPILKITWGPTLRATIRLATSLSNCPAKKFIACIESA